MHLCHPTPKEIPSILAGIHTHIHTYVYVHIYTPTHPRKPGIKSDPCMTHQMRSVPTVRRWRRS